MNRRRHRQQLRLCCVYAIVAMSQTVAGTTLSPSSSSPSSSSSSSGGPPSCVFGTASDGLDACVTRSPAELSPDRIRLDGVGGASRMLSVATSRQEGRGKKKKKKNTAMNIILGGGIMTAFVMTFMYLNLITVTLGKAFLFTFITKFLVSVNWKSSSSKKKSSGKDVTVVMT